MKIAVVTGGTRGIGEGISRKLAEVGYSVVACGVSEAELASFEPHARISTQQLDVTDAASVSKVVASCGAIDLLVNCAGIIQRDGREFDLDNFRSTVEVNLVGTMRMCIAARDKLGSASGAIVNMASMLSFQGSPYVPGYSASKGGVAQLTKSLAGAWASQGIRVNAVAPGWIATELTKGLVADEDRSASILARTPMRRWGNPEDVGGVVLFLASDAARFVTGAIIPVDGGYLAV